MKCPHCQIEFHDQTQTHTLGRDIEGFWSLDVRTCPACRRYVMELVSHPVVNIQGVIRQSSAERLRYLVLPKAAARPAPSPLVPTEFAKDYIESSLVIGDSPQASAALSRRCLQNLLREKAGATQSNLAKQIENVLASGQLPSYLSTGIDAVRNIGNFAAHPIKGTNSGEVLPVEAGEAEWTLDVLEGLFDFYFVQPAVMAQRRDALNTKLASANKPPIKG